MSCFDVKILDPNINTIEIETCIGDQPASIDILTYDNTSLIEVNHCVALLPSEINDLITVKDILAGSGINVADNSGIYTISLSNPTIYTSGIIDFVEGVQDIIGNSGLVSGSYISLNYNDNSGFTTISATGLQPSGNYSVIGHSHSAIDITDFNSSVSGLLPVKNITSGSGISVSNSSGDFTISVTGSFGLTSEQVDDRVNDLLKAGSYVNINYNDSLDSLTISVTGVQPSGNYSVEGHSHVIADVSGLQNALDNKQPSGSYAPLVHSHASSDITDFNSSVSGLLPNTYDAAISWTPNHTLVDGTRYLAGDLVYESGRLYKANYDNESLPVSNTTYWTDVGPGYRLNIDGRDIPNIQYPVTSVNGYSGIIELSTTDLDDFNSSVSGLLPSITGTEYVKTSLANNSYTISVSGLQPSGNYANAVHTHSYTDITNFASGIDQEVSTLLVAGNYINLNYDNVADTLTISATGVQPSGNYSVVGHTHTSSNITDFNSSVSGLLPVKNISAGSGIGISSVSGDFTVSVTGTFGLTSEEVDDRVSQLLVAGTGVSLTYNDPSGILTIDNRHTEINILSQEPQGFVNRTDSIISFDDSSRTFTIQPAISGGSYTIYAEGVRVIKSGVETVVLASGTALNYLHFDTTPPYTLHTKTTGFDFDTDIPIAFIHWNSDINQSTFFGEERHGIRMDSVTHKWIHNTFGMQYISGLSIGGYVLLGDGSSNSHAQIDISDGILYQEDIIINITNGVGTGSFIQPLSPIANIPTYYHSGTTGQWVRDAATAFPLKYNATRAQYNLYSGGSWTTPNVPDKRYFAMWIVATNDINDPILAVMGQREDSSLTAAESNNKWSDINLTNIPTQEIRPLYRLIFTTDNTFTNTPKSSLQSILDIRTSIQSVSAGVTQNDHGSLFGLADDDHSQYVHIDNARTIDAIHTFTNGLNASGLINASSGNFTSLTVNSTGVSLVGHTHISSNITDFNSSVSGLLPVTNILGGSNISVVPSGTVYTVSVSGQLGLTAEEVDDRVSGLLVAGSGINLNYNDNGNALTIAVSGLSSSSTIGNGVSGVINYDLSQTLNIVGSGSTSVDYNNTSKTVSISSPSLIREYELINDNKSTFTVTGGYSLNNLDVYHNGIKLLASGDYSATNGSTFSLIQPAVSGDVVEWMGYSVVPRHQLILGEVRSDYVGDTNYIGRAVAGSSENANVWGIKKYVVNSNGIDIITTTASNVSWTNRLSATYV